MTAFISAMRDAGLEFTGAPIIDGEIHRFKNRGDKKPDSWYLLYPDKPVAGAFGCWKRGIRKTWCEKKEREYKPDDWVKIQARWKQAAEQRKVAEAERHMQAKGEAQTILSESSPAESHDYLTSKKVGVHGNVRTHEGLLVLPLRDIDGELHSLQTITDDGEKKFLYGGKITGCFFTVSGKATGPLVICEGYATGASIFEATGYAVIAAMNCGNLMAVANAVRQRWDSREIVIASDNDSHTEGNPGILKAWRASQAIGAQLSIPVFKNTDDGGTDFNDLYQSEGLEQVKSQITAALRSQFNKGSDDELPPHSFESERCIIGCCLADPKTCVPVFANRFSNAGDVFYDAWCGAIMEAMLSMWDDRKGIDMVTLSQHLRDHGYVDELDGEYSLKILKGLIAATSNYESYLDVVENKWVLRRAIQFCGKFNKLALSSNGNTGSIIDEFEQQAMTVRGMRKQSCPPITELVDQAIEDIERDFQNHGKREGVITTGLIDLDRMFINFQPGEFIVIAGYPGSGKTALAANIADHVAMDLKIPTGFFSLEMLARSVTRRIICSRAKVDWKNARSGELSNEEFKRMGDVGIQLRKSPLFFDDASDISIFELRAKARKMKQEHDIKFALVDYLQLLTAVSKDRKFENRQQEVSDISRGIKGMAKELGIPVIVLSQLNDDGRLRESRSIGQDADDVIILGVNEDDKKKDVQRVDADIYKQRNGPTGIVPLIFMRQYTRFESVAKITNADSPPVKSPPQKSPRPTRASTPDP